MEREEEEDDRDVSNSHHNRRQYGRSTRNVNKAKAHKRSNNRASGGSSSYRKHNRVERRGRSAKNSQQRKKQTTKSTNPNQSSTLKPIQVSRSSIHSDWKKELGGIIRYFVNTVSARGVRNEHEIMKELESLYFENGCDTNQTKNAMLSYLGASIPKNEDGSGNRQDVENNSWKWVDIQMAIETSNDSSNDSTINTATPTQQPINDEILQSFIPSEDNKGILLKNEIHQGEGPAHSFEKWTNIIVPQWAIGKSYFFQMVNKSPLNLSCEMTIDDHIVARNVPIPANSSRMIRPDNARYFETHKWIIQPAQKLKLNEVMKGGDEGIKHVQFIPNPSQNRQKSRKRYNSLRPNYDNKRVCLTAFPDPTAYGWTFTGSSEKSRVEFFEKEMNLGLIKLDFYYTTGTVKTTLVHPTTGANSLFRNTVTPEIYIQILQNPRSHTNRGYRDLSDRPADIGDLPMMEDSDDQDNDLGGDEDIDMGGGGGAHGGNGGPDLLESSCPQYARNDNYDFDNEGHTNRATAMSKLEETSAYNAWEQAARKEWACIHAKFYISLPKRQYQNKNHKGRQNSNKSNQEDLPQQAPIIDVKAAEKATLGTKFHAIGPSESKKRSNVIMRRINGLNDSKEYRAAPVFEYKLYYRAEEEVCGKVDSDDDDEMEEDGQVGKSETPLSNELLNEIKKEKIHQVTKWHETSTFDDPDEAKFVLENRVSFINAAETMEKVESIVGEYLEWWKEQKWGKQK